MALTPGSAPGGAQVYESILLQLQQAVNALQQQPGFRLTYASTAVLPTDQTLVIGPNQTNVVITFPAANANPRRIVTISPLSGASFKVAGQNKDTVDAPAASSACTYQSDGSGRWYLIGTAATSAGSPLTTKGDLYGYSTTNARVPVGSDGQVLVADSTQALGVKWGSSGAAWTQTSMTLSGATTLSAPSGNTLYLIAENTGTQNLILPHASTSYVLIVQNLGPYDLVLGSQTGDTLNGVTGATAETVPDAYTALLFSDGGTNWYDAFWLLRQRSLSPYYAVTTKTGGYTALNTDCVILMNNSAATATVTLPTAAGNAGKLFIVKRLNIQTVLVNANTNGCTIDGVGQVTLGSQYSALQIVSDGSNWYEIAKV